VPADSVSILGIPEAELTPKVRAAITTLLAEMDRLRGELQDSRQRYDELERDANQDPLVPVLNRRAFVREMGRLISFAGRYNMTASLVYFDLNTFKALNDTHGHAAGDAALLHVGNLLMAHVRESDIVGRLGGDEFGIILASATEEVALKKAESLAELLAKSPLSFEGHELTLSAAFGTYEFKSGESAQLAMANADLAMFKRKRSMKSAP
jgi:diguanylate cyclase (GGDEF)-like protein